MAVTAIQAEAADLTQALTEAQQEEAQAQVLIRAQRVEDHREAAHIPAHIRAQREGQRLTIILPHTVQTAECREHATIVISLLQGAVFL